MADPVALSLAERVGALQAAHPWLDTPLVATLAQSTLTPQQTVQQGDVLKQNLQTTWGAVAGAWDDPALYTHDGADVQLRAYLSNSMGPAPVAQQDLVTTQKNLQAKGYGVGLPTDGTWGPEWQSQLNAAHNDYTSNAYAGNRPLSTNAHKAAHGFLSSLMPGNMAHTLIGYAKALPREVANAASDVIGGAAEIVSGVPLGIEQAVTGHGAEGIREAQRIGANVGTSVNTALGGKKMTAEEFYNRQTSAAEVINDIGTILTVTPGGAGAAAAERLGIGATGAYRYGLVRGLTDVSSEASKAAAVRGPLVIARTLGSDSLRGRLLRGSALGAGVGAGVAAAQGTSITRGAEYGALGGATGNALIGSRLGRAATERLPGGFLSNHPIQAWTSPVVGKLTSGDGLYYRARTLLAQPYRIPVVRGAGNAYAAAIPYGLGAAGQSALAGHFDPNNSLTTSIASDTTLDPLDERLKAVTSGLTGGHVALGLNDLVWFLHGDLPLPGMRGASSQAVGRAVDSVSDHINDGLGKVGANGAITRAMQAVYGKKWTPQYMIDTTFQGDVSAYNHFWTNKLDKLGVARYAEQEVHRWIENNGGIAPSYEEKKQIVEAASSEAWHNPDIRQEQLKFLVSSNNPLVTGELENRLRAQIVGAMQEPEMAQRHGAFALVSAEREMAAILADPESAKQLISPAAWATHAAERATEEGSTLTRKPDRAWLGANSGLVMPGSEGLARLDTLSKQQAHAYVDTLESALSDETLTDEQRDLLVNEAYDWLHHHGNFDDLGLRVFEVKPGENGTVNLIDRMREYADSLGSPIHLALDASPELKAAVARIREHGYQLWHGTDIGHHLSTPMVPAPLAGTGITRARKVISAMGLNPEHFRSSDVGAYIRDAFRNNLQKLIDDGKLSMPPYMTPDTLITRLRTHADAQAKLGVLPDAIFSLTAPWRKTLVQAQADAQGKTTEEVLAEMKNELARYHSVRDIPRRVFHEVLSSTDDLPYATSLARGIHGQDDLPLFTPDQIDLIHQAAIKAGGQVPGYMIGAGRFDNLIRSGFGLGGEGWNIPLGPMGVRIKSDSIARAGNTYGRLRDNFRFTMSPAFSARRVTKTRIKLEAEGLLSTSTPVKDLLEGKVYGPQTPSRLQGTKVTQADGRPLLVYHGTQADFEHFDDATHGDKGWYGPGHYFTVDPNYAKTYAGEEGNVKRAFLNIKNPLEWFGSLTKSDAQEFLKLVGRENDPWAKDRLAATRNHTMETLSDALIHPWVDYPASWEESVARVQSTLEAKGAAMHQYNPVSEVRFNRAVRKFAEARGHDGIAHYEYVPGPIGETHIPENGVRSFVAFRANQVHSAEQDLGHDVYQAAHRYYATLFPEHADQAADEFDRALHSADIFAIYQPRQYAAHAAWQAKQMGWSDERVKAMITRVFEYGSARYGEGRTAAERTANTIFFPFSFEKTVLRNIGGYLLDHPAQLATLNAGLAAYDAFSKAHPGDPLSGPYLQAHVPLLHEIIRLNPFGHGLSPGEFGGINAPLLNMFLPQSWDQSNPNNLGLLGRLVPAMNDITRTWKEVGQQSVIAHNAMQNVYDYAADKRADNPFYKYRPVVTPVAQREQAFKDRAKLIKALQPVLDANAHLGSGKEYTFSNDPSVDPALRGEVVSKAAVDQLLHELYPAYDPAGAAKYATEVQTKSRSFLNSIKGTPNFLAYAKFADAVDKFRGHVQAGDYRAYPDQQAQLTSQLRAFAFAAALHGKDGQPDDGFTHWYNTTFSKALGPLTGAP